jgi:hypothetical protein
MAQVFEVHMGSVDGGPTALGWAGPFTLVADRPVEDDRGDPPVSSEIRYGTGVELGEALVRGAGT